MNETTRDRTPKVRTIVSACILLAMSAMVALSGETRSGLGRGYQDPSVPESPPAVSLAPDNIDFGNQVVRTTSAAKRITVKNTGGKPLYFDSVELGGDNPNSFTVLKDTCTGASVDPGRACIVDVTFRPTGTGDRNARLKLNDNAPDSPQRLRIKGAGINSNDVPPF
jgi:HYDIN/CFA65/VesB family protein